MVSQVDIVPLWSRGINFKAFTTNTTLNYEQVESTLRQFSGNFENHGEGWLTDYPYFRSEDGSIASFVYTRFVKDAKASRELRRDVLVPDYVGCNFHFNENIVIVTTASNTKINGMVRTSMFNALSSLTTLRSVQYTPDFLFWLAYKHDIEGTRIIDDLKIDSIKAISSEVENMNLSGAVSANSNVTNRVQAQLMLAIYGFVNGAEVTISNNNEIFSFKILADGRVNVKTPSFVDTAEQKARYALDVHNHLQVAYNQFEIHAASDQWAENKKSYRCSKLDNCTASIGTFREGLIDGLYQ